MDKIINKEQISGIEDKPAVTAFVDTVNTVSPESSQSDLIAAIVLGAVEAISNLEDRIATLEGEANSGTGGGIQVFDPDDRTWEQ